MQTIFIGGPGRSGTSFVADRLANHPQISALRGVELKLFTEKNGLLDLWHSFIERYSPNRAMVARQQFMRLTDALIGGQYGQPGLNTLASQDAWEDVFATFLQNALPFGPYARTNPAIFQKSCFELIKSIAQLSTDLDKQPKVFLEKTPHALLAVDFLADIVPGAQFVHIMRDPRSIAQSLRNMRWGPDSLSDCCDWVAGYCDEWVNAQRTAANAGLPISRFFIEDIAKQPEASAAHICNAIGLHPDAGLFHGASLQVLNGWAERCPPADLTTFKKRLAGWVSFFGYSAHDIGQRNPVGVVANSVPSSDGEFDEALLPETF